VATIKGTKYADTKSGTTAADLIYGYEGNDKLYGKAGNDSIWGGLNDDQLWGDDGLDILRGDDGRDSLWGGNSNDTLYGGAGDDNLYGDAGTDKVYGEAGNDVLKGGTGISYLYGGAGNDTAHYDPSTSDIDDIGNYLSGSYIEAETVYIYNKTTDNGKPTQTVVWNPDVNHEAHDQYIGFSSGAKTIQVGYTEGNPDLVFVGAGGLKYHGPDYGGLSKVTGTAVKDEFHGGYGKDILKGGAGNDDFYISGGNDLMISETNDADTFHFKQPYPGTHATITGFNGAGTAGGDTIYFGNGGSVPTEAGGKTTFVQNGESVYEEADPQLTVDAVGLKEGIDYFFM
jgi:Ca2+-binding RTX toxin-like protein